MWCSLTRLMPLSVLVLRLRPVLVLESSEWTNQSQDAIEHESEYRDAEYEYAYERGTGYTRYQPALSRQSVGRLTGTTRRPFFPVPRPATYGRNRFLLPHLPWLPWP